MQKIILTGGIASGKTTACKIFQSLGVPIIDADKIAHDLLKPNTPAYHQVVKHFGAGILDDNDKNKNKNNLNININNHNYNHININIDRAALGQIIFSNLSEKNWLEDLLHPLILTKIKLTLKKLEKISPPPVYCIIDIPIYAEIVLSPTHQLKKAFATLGDKIVVIDVDEETQKKRLWERYQNQDHNKNQKNKIPNPTLDPNITLNTIEAILAAQASRQDRNQLADIIIENNQDITHLTEAINVMRF